MDRYEQYPSNVLEASRDREHIECCKQRAFRYLLRGQIHQAWAAFCAHMLTRPAGYRLHEMLAEGTERLARHEIATSEEMRRFIEGF